MFSKGFSLSLVSVLGLGASVAQAQTTWTFGGINPPNAPVTIASKKFAELVGERTEGRVTIDFYEGSQLGNGPAQIEAMAMGAQRATSAPARTPRTSSRNSASWTSPSSLKVRTTS